MRGKYNNDDHSRFAGPEYLDRISLSKAKEHFLPSKEYSRPDALIYEDICEAFLNDSKIDASNIKVEVHNGIVTLSGSVEGRVMKREAENCIEHILGIEDVFNLIILHQFHEAGAEGLIKNQARIDP